MPSAKRCIPSQATREPGIGSKPLFESLGSSKARIQAIFSLDETWDIGWANTTQGWLARLCQYGTLAQDYNWSITDPVLGALDTESHGLMGRNVHTLLVCSFWAPN